MTGSELRRLRAELHMTQRQLAAALGLSWTTICDYEAAPDRPRHRPIPQLVELALVAVTARRRRKIRRADGAALARAEAEAARRVPGIVNRACRLAAQAASERRFLGVVRGTASGRITRRLAALWSARPRQKTRSARPRIGRHMRTRSMRGVGADGDEVHWATDEPRQHGSRQGAADRVVP
jgi:DNA-binding XRE family transcriptional regulator